MPIDSTRETMIAFLHDLSAGGPFERHFVTDVTLTVLGTGDVITGRAAVARAIRQFYQEAFDAHMRVKVVLIEHEQAVVELDVIGTHRGMYRGVAATGKEVCVPCSIALNLRCGAITELVGYLPIDRLLEQIEDPPSEDTE